MFDTLDSGSIDVTSNVLGGGLNFPKGFWEPGSLSAHKGHFGQGSTATPFFASLVSGPSASAAYSFYSTGLNLSNGTTIQQGVHETIGQSLVVGTEFKTYVVSNELDAVSNNFVAASKNSFTSAKENRFIAPLNIISGVQTKINGSVVVDGVGDLAVVINSKKGFDIPHPTKEGWRVSHVCVEGPTADVYLRGKLRNSNSIKLPEYWKGLVDPETITVNLTPIGKYQELFVYSINNTEEIIIKNNRDSIVNCDYYIMGERIDTEKNIPEYEGTWNDYPGDNSTRSIVGKDYDLR
jgi:hypothetical protein